jgi:hypothetical protein
LGFLLHAHPGGVPSLEAVRLRKGRRRRGAEKDYSLFLGEWESLPRWGLSGRGLWPMWQCLPQASEDTHFSRTEEKGKHSVARGHWRFPEVMRKYYVWGEGGASPLQISLHPPACEAHFLLWKEQCKHLHAWENILDFTWLLGWGETLCLCFHLYTCLHLCVLPLLW